MYIKTLIEERVETPVVEDTPVKKILKDARALLGDPSRWHKGAYAATELGNNQPDPLAENAVRWCALGAVMKAAGARTKEFSRLFTGWESLADDACDALMASLGGCVPQFNDHPNTEHSAVLAMFDKAIEDCDR